jgi:cation/acetate symporter
VPTNLGQTTLGTTNPLAIAFFLGFVLVTLGITYWAAKRTRSTSEFYAAGRSITGFQNGLALAGDFMSAASFLGIAGLVATGGYDGLIYSVGYLVGWPIVMFLIAEPLRNLGKYTFADVVAFRLKQRPVRTAAATASVVTVLFYLTAQMVGAGSLIKLMFGLPYEWALLIVGVLMIAYVLFGGMLARRGCRLLKLCSCWAARLLVILTLAHFGWSYSGLFGAVANTPAAINCCNLSSRQGLQLRHSTSFRSQSASCSARPVCAYLDALLHGSQRQRSA